MDKDHVTTDNSQFLEDSFDISSLLLDYLGNWKWFVLNVVVCLSIAYYYIATIIPINEVTYSIYLNGEDSQSKASAVSLSGEAMLNMKQFLDETELEIMRSRNNMVKVVDSLGLQYSYAQIGRMRDVPEYNTNPIIVTLDSAALRGLETMVQMKIHGNGPGKVAVDLINGAEKTRYELNHLPDTLDLPQGRLEVKARSKDFKELNTPMRVDIRPRNWAASSLSSSMSIQFAENSFTIVRINFRTPLVQAGKDVVNSMIKFYNDDVIADKNRAAIQTEAFIVERLRMIADDLKAVENQLEQYQRDNNAVELRTQTTMNLSLKSTAESEMTGLRSERETLREALNGIRSVGQYQEIPFSPMNSEVASKIDNYNRLVSRYNRLAGSLTDEAVQIRDLKDELSAQRTAIITSLNQAIKSLDRQIGALAGQAGQAAANTASTPTKDKGLQQIFRDQQVKVNIYTFLLQKREEIALQKNLATPTARLIDDPTGSGPVSPRSSALYGMAALIGLVIPGLLIYLRRLIFPVFKDKDELERSTKVPVLSEICRIRKPENIVIKANDNSVEAELFRLLRNNVQFILGKGKVILVTSSLSGEGKTIVASNLGMSFALTGKRTLVVGMDIRRPALAHNFGLSNRAGLTTYLCGQTDDWKGLVKTTTENADLFIMPAGPVPPNPNELLLSERLDKFISEARNEYDCVVIDSAPIGLVSDSLLVARVTDVQLYVARANYSTRRCVKMMHQAINSGQFTRTYMVLNGVNMQSNSYRYRRYGSYGSYGGGHGNSAYGYGYSETPKPSSRLKSIWRKANRK